MGAQIAQDTERIAMGEYKKPWVYNPKTAEERIKELEEQNERFRDIIDTQVKTIDRYHETFKMLEAEVKRLQNDNNTHDNKQTL